MDRRAVDPASRTGIDRIFGRLLEIEGMRSDQHRAIAGGRLDEVLPAERQQAAADEGKIGQRVVGRHLPHAVAQPDLGVGSGQGQAAADETQSLALQQAGHLVETLRVTRHQNQQGIRHIEPAPGIEHQ